MEIDENNCLYRDKEMYLGPKKIKTGYVSRNESNTVRKNQLEKENLKKKIQHIEYENSFNFKNIAQSSLDTEKFIEKIKSSTGKSFKLDSNPNLSDLIDSSVEGI